MPERPKTQTLNITETRREFNQLIDDVARGARRILVEKSGLPVAAIISPADLARFQVWEAERRQDFAAMRRIGEAFQDVDPEEVEREAVKAVREVRRERWQQNQDRLTHQHLCRGGDRDAP